MIVRALPDKSDWSHWSSAHAVPSHALHDPIAGSRREDHPTDHRASDDVHPHIGPSPRGRWSPRRRATAYKTARPRRHPVSPANTSDRPNLTKSHEALRATGFRTTIDPTSDLGRGPGGRGSGARIELAYGTWLRRRRRGIQCRTPLRSAAVTLEQIGATGARARRTRRARRARTGLPERAAAPRRWRHRLGMRCQWWGRAPVLALENRDCAAGTP